jgi:hypothetical protein
MSGFKAEVLVQGEWSRNGQVWPDAESARKAGSDLMGRWMLVEDFRVVEVADTPTEKVTWDEKVAEHGLPPRRVQL